MVLRAVPAFFLLTLTCPSARAQQATFPDLQAPNLFGKMLSLPGDFSGDLNLVFFVFEQDQQREADSWREAAPELFKGYPGIQNYEVVVLQKDYKMARFFIHRGMLYGIHNPEQRARTVTLYLDKAPFEQTLQIPDERRISVLLLDRKGRVLWRERGLYYDIKGN